MTKFDKLISAFEQIGENYFKDPMSDNERKKQKNLLLSSIVLILIYFGNEVVISNYKIIESGTNPLCQTNIWIIFLVHFYFIVSYALSSIKVYLNEKYNKERFKYNLKGIKDSFAKDFISYHGYNSKLIDEIDRKTRKYIENSEKNSNKYSIGKYYELLEKVKDDFEELDKNDAEEKKNWDNLEKDYDKIKEVEKRNNPKIEENNRKIDLTLKNIENLVKSLKNGKRYLNSFFIVELILPFFIAFIAVIIFFIKIN